jgi:hypothetical protein
VYCVCLGGKWSGEWQISRNFGACGAAGKFFFKFRETLANPNAVGRKYPYSRTINTRSTPVRLFNNVLSFHFP